jgi:hypothetical protein
MDAIMKKPGRFGSGADLPLSLRIMFGDTSIFTVITSPRTHSRSRSIHFAAGMLFMNYQQGPAIAS